MGFPGGTMVKDLSANAGDAQDVSSIPEAGRSLEDAVTTHSSILVWEIPWTEKSGGLQSMGSQSQTQLSN